jgi:hypothetical protein
MNCPTGAGFSGWHRNASQPVGFGIGHKTGHSQNRSLHPKTPTRSRYLYPCADNFSEFSELDPRAISVMAI